MDTAEVKEKDTAEDGTLEVGTLAKALPTAYSECRPIKPGTDGKIKVGTQTAEDTTMVCVVYSRPQQPAED